MTENGADMAEHTTDNDALTCRLCGARLVKRLNPSSEAASQGTWFDHPQTSDAPLAPVSGIGHTLSAVIAPAMTGEGVGTGAGEGATGQDTGTAWVTRSADCPEAPAQAHPFAAPPAVTEKGQADD